MSSFNPHMCIHPTSHVRESRTHHHHHHHHRCAACEGPILSARVLYCNACNSNLHPLCKNRPPSLVSHVHPHHPLSLRAYPIRPTRCNICKTEIHGMSYTCSPCDFDAHPECSQLPLHVPCGHNADARPENSPHSLRLQLDDSSENCAICGVCCGRWAYRCEHCLVTIHFTCLVVIRDDPVDLNHQASRSLRFPPRLGSGLAPVPTWSYYYYAPPIYYNYYPYNGQGYVMPNNNGGGSNIAAYGGGGIGGSISGFASRIAVGVLCNVVVSAITSGL